jgi:SPRY domain
VLYIVFIRSTVTLRYCITAVAYVCVHLCTTTLHHCQASRLRRATLVLTHTQHTSYTLQVHPGDTVRCEVDMEEGTLRYSVNGEEQEGGFDSIEGDIYPCVGSYRAGVKIRLLKVEVMRGSALASTKTPATSSLTSPEGLHAGGLQTGDSPLQWRVGPGVKLARGAVFTVDRKALELRKVDRLPASLMGSHSAASTSSSSSGANSSSSSNSAAAGATAAGAAQQRANSEQQSSNTNTATATAAAMLKLDWVTAHATEGFAPRSGRHAVEFELTAAAARPRSASAATPTTATTAAGSSGATITVEVVTPRRTLSSVSARGSSRDSGADNSAASSERQQVYSKDSLLALGVVWHTAAATSATAAAADGGSSSNTSGSSATKPIGICAHSAAWWSDGTLRCSSSSTTAQQQQVVAAAYGPALAGGDVVTMTVDSAAGTVSYAVNGVAVGVAFGPAGTGAAVITTALCTANTAVYPAASLSCERQGVELRSAGTVGTQLWPLVTDLRHVAASLGGRLTATLIASKQVRLPSTNITSACILRCTLTQ